MATLIMIEQHLICGHIIATIENLGKTRSLTIVTQNFDEAEMYSLMECDNVTDVDFVEGEYLDFYVKYPGNESSTYVKFERKYL